MKLSAKTSVRRAPDDVFAYLANRTNLPEWAMGVGAVRKLSKGATGVGARFRIEGKLGGRVLASVYEITEFESPSRLSGRNTGLLGFEETYELQSAGDGTEIRQQAEVRLQGHFLFLSPLLRMALGSQLKKDFANLKRVLEGVPIGAAAGSQAGAE